MRRVSSPDWPSRAGTIAFVGEAPAAEEIRRDRYFVGKAGRLFDMFLARAGIRRSDCLVTNVFDFELPDNEVSNICVSQKEAKASAAGAFESWMKTPVDSGAYVPADILIEQFSRLEHELKQAAPNVVVPLGGTAVWALLCTAPYGKMKKLRGTLGQSAFGPWKCIPTYHPAYIARNFHHSPMLFSDFVKAKRESRTPELNLPERNAVVAESVEQVRAWLRGPLNTGWPVSVDIETAYGQIDCIGFANSIHEAFVVPFARILGKRKGKRPLANYWYSAEDETAVLVEVARLLGDPAIPKLGQNFNYDVAWIHEEWGVKVRNWRDDTRLQHLALWPELQADLATMTALHLTVPPWKLKGAHTHKPDE